MFPPLRLLIGLDKKDATPAKTPWPLLALRIAIAALVVLAMAGPIWNALPRGAATGPLLLIVDDGWAAAPTWARASPMRAPRSAAAARSGRLVALGADLARRPRSHRRSTAPRAEEKLRALEPVAYAPARMATLPPIQRFLAANPRAEVSWIADGLELGGAGAFARALRRGGRRASGVGRRSTARRPLALAGADNLAGALTRI